MAYTLIEHLGPVDALEAIREPRQFDEPMRQQVERWRHRLATEPFHLRALEKSRTCVIAPEDALWPGQLNDLGSQAPALAPVGER